MKNIFCILILVFSHYLVFSQNPIVPPGVYVADPSAKVWKDGKLYIYGSRDESPEYYCSWKYHVLSTNDLKSWTIHENAFASKGEGDEVTYSDKILYAPDAEYKNGLFYLYYCLATNQMTEGVATSKFPVGPFKNGKNINVYGYNQIDPATFIDDDGQAYYLWGQGTVKMAKMKPNMIEIDSASLLDQVLTEKEHFFHEGADMFKRNGIYYIVYAHMGRGGRPTCIAYATSKSAMGPYKYGGVIIDNDHSDPAVWNNHGSVIEYNGQWYVFYHRSTHNSNTMRKACVEPIQFNEDGSIDEVEMTSQGAGGPLKAKEKIEAEQACLLYGNVRIQMQSSNNEELAEMRNDDKASYKYIDFENGVESVEIKVAPGAKGGRIDIAIDNSWGPSIGYVDIPAGDGKTYQTFTGKLKKTGGVHAVWLRFWGEKGAEMYKVDSFRFR